MDDYTNSPYSTPDNSKVTKIRILLEHIDSYYVATSIDEYGTVCKKRNVDKDKAIEKCKEDTTDMIGGECDFTVEELYSSDTTKDDDKGDLAGAT